MNTLILLFVFLCGCATTQQSPNVNLPEKNQIKIVTYNMKGFSAVDVKTRTQQAAQILAINKPDIILVQEGVGGLYPGVSDSIFLLRDYMIDQGWPMNAFTISMTGYPGIMTYRLGILSVFPIIAQNWMEIIQPLEVEQLMPWHRKVLGVTLQSDKGRINVFNTHWSGSNPIRNQAEQTIDFINKNLLPASVEFFGGDLNTTYQDLILATGGTRKPGLDGFTTGNVPGIDLVLTRKSKFISYITLINDPTITDHPVPMFTFER
jgi:endonuclease/exonuclease/phosphatase family metal-dependent hydrolase